MQSTPRHYQQLQPEERVTLASLVQQKFGIEMAGMLNRSPSTISRELSRNSGTEGYASAQAREQAPSGARLPALPSSSMLTPCCSMWCATTVPTIDQVKSAERFQVSWPCEMVKDAMPTNLADAIEFHWSPCVCSEY